MTRAACPIAAGCSRDVHGRARRRGQRGSSMPGTDRSSWPGQSRSSIARLAGRATLWGRGGRKVTVSTTATARRSKEGRSCDARPCDPAFPRPFPRRGDRRARPASTRPCPRPAKDRRPRPRSRSQARSRPRPRWPSRPCPRLDIINGDLGGRVATSALPCSAWPAGWTSPTATAVSASTRHSHGPRVIVLAATNVVALAITAARLQVVRGQEGGRPLRRRHRRRRGRPLDRQRRERLEGHRQGSIGAAGTTFARPIGRGSRV